MFIEGSNTRFVSCTFIGNQTLFHGGALLVQNSVATVDSCVIARSQGNLGGVGVFATGAQTTSVSRSTIVENTANRGGGFYVSSGLAIIDRTIVAQNNGNGLEAATTGLVTDTCNDVWQNVLQNYVLVSMGNTSFSLDPLFCDPDQDNWQLLVDSPCAPAHSPVCGRIGALPVGCGGDFYSRAGRAPRSPAALNAAVSGDTVAVAEGVYLEHITLKPAIKLLGRWRSDFAVRDPLLYPQSSMHAGS